MHGELLAYERGVPFAAEARLSNGDRPLIVTVAVYLEDHSSPITRGADTSGADASGADVAAGATTNHSQLDGHTGLWVHPGTHRPLAEWRHRLFTPSGARNTTACSDPANPFSARAVPSKLGDVVIFHALLYHRGIGRPNNPRLQVDHVDHRILFTLYYGLWPSAFSTSQHRGFLTRNQLINTPEALNAQAGCRVRTPYYIGNDPCLRLYITKVDLKAQPLPAGIPAEDLAKHPEIRISRNFQDAFRKPMGQLRPSCVANLSAAARIIKR